jgi:hypothetical protein
MAKFIVVGADSDSFGGVFNTEKEVIDHLNNEMRDNPALYEDDGSDFEIYELARQFKYVPPTDKGRLIAC